MDFKRTESQKALQASARAFARNEIEPEAREFDEKGLFPWDTFRKMGREGFLGITVPASYGGGNGGAMEYSILCEEIAKTSAAYIHNGHYQTEKMLIHHGTQEQRRELLPKLASGEYLAATAVSETGVGSSFNAMASTARREKDGYILNGEKVHINDAAEAQIINFFAMAPQGLTVFLVDPKLPGFFIREKMDPIGLRASPIYSFRLQEYRVPESRRVGEEGQGARAFFSAFNRSRIGNASCLLGIAAGALEKAIAFIKDRKVGNKVVADFQGIRWMVAELSTKLEAVGLLRDRAAWMEDQGEDPVRETSMAKLLAGEVSMEVVSQAIQLTGSHGCYRDTPFERYLRDAKCLCIAGGTLEVMKNNIARQILG
ncbi:MAG: acyl-CoA dehydrogenase family protein [Deltaproteobacteria bacterium]|nr:acyl-CoA dehydrogenase family protein [Deltaproteobacteria bacterium]